MRKGDAKRSSAFLAERVTWASHRADAASVSRGGVFCAGALAFRGRVVIHVRLRKLSADDVSSEDVARVFDVVLE